LEWIFTVQRTSAGINRVEKVASDEAFINQPAIGKLQAGNLTKRALAVNPFGPVEQVNIDHFIPS